MNKKKIKNSKYVTRENGANPFWGTWHFSRSPYLWHPLAKFWYRALCALEALINGVGIGSISASSPEL